MAKSDTPKGSAGTSPVQVGGGVTIGGNIRARDVVGGARITGEIVGRDIIDGRDTNTTIQIVGGGNVATAISPKETLSSKQALGRIADAVRLNLDQRQLNMEQARRESSQFFRTTMIFSGVAFTIILRLVA